MSVEFITITAIDKHSSDSMGRTFSVSDEQELKKAVLEWEKELPYRRYGLTTQDFIEDYSEEVQEVLEDLEVE